MMNIPDFYTTGLPIETEIGFCEFLKVRDYPLYVWDLQVLGMSKLQIIYKYVELNKDRSLNGFISELEKSSLYEIAFGLPNLRQSYCNLFIKVFGDEGVLEKLNVENFDMYRKLIMDMNCVKEEKINPNPEIQRAIERSKRVKSQNGETLTFADITSSIVAFSGHTYEEINDMTIYQFYMTYQRIAKFKNFDVSTLFSTVSSEKINIESWSKHIDLFEEEKHFISEDEFKKNTGKVFDE